jgi:hypothetical protein
MQLPPLFPAFKASDEVKRGILQPKTMNRQLSFPDLGETDLFSDLSGFDDSLDDFAIEDPFQLIF